MQIPLSYADAVIGTNGSSISYIRRVSGATVTIQEARGVPGEMTVEISGTASQVQTAQQLIQVIFLVLAFELLLLLFQSLDSCFSSICESDILFIFLITLFSSSIVYFTNIDVAYN